MCNIWILTQNLATNGTQELGEYYNELKGSLRSKFKQKLSEKISKPKVQVWFLPSLKWF